ncbi:hypothetical protein [Robertkochia aurantiaca]|nr:hypothetical protein [Robertkochia sp. 3YJGBD-33]
MSEKNARPSVLTDYRIHTRIKLSALWTTLMFLYIYTHYHIRFGR